MKCKWCLGGVTPLGEVRGLAPTGQSSSKNRVTRCFSVRLRMKRTEEELVTLLDMKDKDCNQ